MNNLYDTRQWFKLGLVLLAILIAIASLVVSDSLIKDLAQEERHKMEIWAEATRLTASTSSSLDMSLVLKIIEGNTTIPVVLCNEKDSVIAYKNMDCPENDSVDFLHRKVCEFKKNNKIIIDMEDGSFQYVYYDDSILLKRLLIYPYVQLSVVSIFILIAFLALVSAKKAEQNNIWVGLSKETAHQLGTPISSLIAWVEYLKSKNIDQSVLAEMEKDVKRLEMITERFSKIGSNPDPKPVDVNQSICDALAYMNTRISSKVNIRTSFAECSVHVLINNSLFAWVVENMIKNAVDAMGGEGEILISVTDRGKKVCIDISDTGKGIVKSKYRTVFKPGYTTKSRGWGLGLSLVRRIIESYAGGKIYVKSSELGKGTTFRIELKKYNS